MWELIKDEMNYWFIYFFFLKWDASIITLKYAYLYLNFLYHMKDIPKNQLRIFWLRLSRRKWENLWYGVDGIVRSGNLSWQYKLQSRQIFERRP